MITVLGATGFIGSHLTRRLREAGVSCYAPLRNESLAGKSLGHVIYCIGLTSDFRSRPFAAVDAHICKLVETLQQTSFDSLVYLSSTRVYRRQGPEKARELDDLLLNPHDIGDLYSLSKATGESMVLTLGARGCVVRLSNVYGADFGQQNFLSAILKEALTKGTITLETALGSAKDYISVADIVELLPRIATSAQERIYNLASGVNVSNEQLTAEIARLTGCAVITQEAAENVMFPTIDTSRIRREFNFRPKYLLQDLPELVESYRQYWRSV